MQSYGPQQCHRLSQTFVRKDGSVTSSADEALSRLQEYYSELLNRTPSVSIDIDSYLTEFTRSTNWALDSMPTMKEFDDIIKKMKNHKATSVDPVPIEIYKYVNSTKLKLQIFQLFSDCFNSSVMPEVTLQTVLCSLFKGGNKSLCENQRGITLTSHYYKIAS